MVVQRYKIERHMDSRGLTLEISEQNNDSLLGTWTRGHSCYILPKNLTVICCPGNVNEMVEDNERWHGI